MRLHQFRVAALFNRATDGVFYTDTNAIEAWTTWIERTDEKELLAFDADIKAAQARYDERAQESAYYEAIEREHVNAYRSTYYTKGNLL